MLARREQNSRGPCPRVLTVKALLNPSHEHDWEGSSRQTGCGVGIGEAPRAETVGLGLMGLQWAGWGPSEQREQHV